MRVRALCESDLSEIEKALALTFHFEKNGDVTVGKIVDALEGSGHAKINKTRLNKKITADKRFVKNGSGFRVSPRFNEEARKIAAHFSSPERPLLSNFALDETLFSNARAYIKNVVVQINISYNYACYDCSAVMIRRLFETLVIDAFEKQGCLAEITKPDGNIHQLSGLISRLRGATQFSISRQTKEAADHLKDVGDWSAHNRRHRALKSDIDMAVRHLRLACSDLLHLAGQD